MQPSDDNYKDRYAKLQEDSSARERKWLSEAEKFRGSVGRLAALAGSCTADDAKALCQSLLKLAQAGAGAEEIEKLAEQLPRSSGKAAAVEEVRPREAGLCVEARDVLIKVLEQLTLPKDLHLSAMEIKKELEKGLPPEKLQWAVDAVAGLMLGLRARMEEDKRQAEVLINEVSRRLVEMEESVISTHKVTADAFASNRALDEKVSAEVNGIRSSAEAATDFSLFRLQLLSSLDSIRHAFEAKRKEDAAREEEEKREVEKLRAHVELLEGQMERQKETIKKALEESHRDALTGCLNRLAFNECIETETARSTRYGHPLSVVMFDIDKFKLINDTYGHQSGDEVLRAVAKIAAMQLRAADYFCRYGGEEFIAVLPNTVGRDALNAAEKVRTAIEQFKFHSRGKRVVITVSAGVAEHLQNEDQKEFVARADKAMYRSKDEGRNRTSLAE